MKVLRSPAALYSAAVLFIFSLSVTVWIFMRSYEDPRWRNYDLNSYQVSESDVYNVAEIPIVDRAVLVGNRLLQIHFLPDINTTGWTISYYDASGTADTRPVTVRVNGHYPEIQFDQRRETRMYTLVPDRIRLTKEIKIEIDFFPTENYHKANLSWPDNFAVEYSSIPFGFRRPYSIDEWVGLPDSDPDLVKARALVRGRYNPLAPTIEKIGAVMTFISQFTKSGTPNDEMQDASPYQTCQMMRNGMGAGFCENYALVYYLFANAAGIKTRLVDMAGKVGPVKVTGHYYDESWVREEGRWIYVDPLYFITHVRNERTGLDLNAFEVKSLNVLQLGDSLLETVWNVKQQKFISRPARFSWTFRKNVTLAYKFGYPRNKSYSKMKHFLFYPTLLISDITIPNYYVVKEIALNMAWISFVALVLTLTVRFFGGRSPAAVSASKRGSVSLHQ